VEKWPLGPDVQLLLRGIMHMRGLAMSRVRSKRAVASVAIATGELVRYRFPPEDISFLLLRIKGKGKLTA
jgi:hypothetical protein